MVFERCDVLRKDDILLFALFSALCLAPAPWLRNTVGLPYMNRMFRFVRDVMRY